MELIVCFIDDSNFEHDLFRNEIAPAAPDIHFIQAYTYEEARDRLGSKVPGLFLLDLWGQDPDVDRPYLTPREEIEKRVAGFNTLDDVYIGLEDYEGDRINEFLKRFFVIVDSWRNVFELVCNRIGQNRKYGLSNLGQARRDYPGVPGVFYTRKSLISDAVAMFKMGSDGLYIKPTGMDDAKTRELTREYAPELIKDLTRIIGDNIEKIYGHQDFYLGKKNLTEMGLSSLISGWKEFINK